MAVCMPQSVCHKPFKVSVVIARVSDSCFVWILPLVECARPWFSRGGWWLVGGQLLAGLAQCAPAACGCSRHTSAPGGGVSPGWRSSWGSSGLLSPCSSSLVGLPSVGCALMGRPTHLDLGSGLGEPLMQLHFLLAHAGGCRGGLRFCRFLRDGRRRGPFQASSAGPELLQILEFLCFTCSCVGGSSPP